MSLKSGHLCSMSLVSSRNCNYFFASVSENQELALGLSIIVLQHCITSISHHDPSLTTNHKLYSMVPQPKEAQLLSSLYRLVILI